VRRIGVVLALVTLAACSHGHATGRATSTTAKSSWQTVQQIAAALCERAKPEPAHLAASFPATIADFRSTTIGTVGPTQRRRFPKLAASDSGAWCWTGRPGEYDVYEVASDGTKELVASGAVGSPALTQGRPDVP
jgi:hypothetical protein